MITFRFITEVFSGRRIYFILIPSKIFSNIILLNYAIIT